MLLSPTSCQQSNYPSPNTFHQPVSAPARLAFANVSRTTPLVSPINPESSDLSPIPSPWLRPTPDYMPMPPMPPMPTMPVLPQKRNSLALSEGGNSNNPTLPFNQLSVVTSGSPHATTSRISATVAGQGVASGTRAQKRHKNSVTPPSSGMTEIGEVGNPTLNSTSVESMPPPSSVQRQRRPSQGEPFQPTGIEPVTPSSIMGLDMRNPPPPRQTRSQNGVPAKVANQTQSKAQISAIETKTTPSSKANSTTQSTSLTSTPTRNNAQQRKQASQSTNQPPKKHTHKDAEQKRRDSLKTSFDELRDLLPPIPLALEDPRFAENPPLPGSLPPRGPPKGDAGPNRHVSKLHLLRCGNDYIRQLKARVERRDREIEKLRGEVMRLRNFVVRERVSMDGGEEIDLEKDLDADEDSRLGIGGMNEPMSTVVEEGEDGNDS
jgi:hypothetical protein